MIPFDVDRFIHGDGHTDVIGDEPHEVAALFLGFVYANAVVSYPLAKVWHATDTFFHRPYNWKTFQYMDSPFDSFRKSGRLTVKNTARNVLRFSGYAHLAWSAGNIAYAGYRGGSQGARDETWNQANSWSFGLLNYWRHKNTTYGEGSSPYYWV